MVAAVCTPLRPGPRQLCSCGGEPRVGTQWLLEWAEGQPEPFLTSSLFSTVIQALVCKLLFFFFILRGEEQKEKLHHSFSASDSVIQARPLLAKKGKGRSPLDWRRCMLLGDSRPAAMALSCALPRPVPTLRSAPGIRWIESRPRWFWFFSRSFQ